MPQGRDLGCGGGGGGVQKLIFSEHDNVAYLIEEDGE